MFAITKRRLRSWIVEEKEGYIKTLEEGDDEYIQERKNSFEKFMHGDEKELKKEKEYQRFKNDRTMMKILRNLKRGITYSRDAAIKSGLRGGRVLDFLNRHGITVTWKVEG